MSPYLSFLVQERDGLLNPLHLEGHNSFTWVYSCNISSMQLSLVNMRIHSFHPASFYVLIWCSISRTASCSPVEMLINIFETVKILITVCMKFIKHKLYSPLCFPVLDALLKFEQKWALPLALVMSKQCKAMGLGGGEEELVKVKSIWWH